MGKILVLKLAIFFMLITFVALANYCSSPKTDWRPTAGRLMTTWAKEVTPNRVHPEYPRPQMVRKDWLNLNGLWEYAIRPKDQQQPGTFDGNILVPFAVESALSGVEKPVGETNRLWYRRTFQVPAEWRKNRILLNFGAVDWETIAWINGSQVGSHRGGYDRFTFDITDALNATGAQEIVLAVWDPVNTGTQPRGKQVKEPRGIWYTSVTGIWQTVWLEPVNDIHFHSLSIVPDIDAGEIRISTNCSRSADGYKIIAEVKDTGEIKGRTEANTDATIILPIKNPRLWSPETPFLYDLNLSLKDRNGNTVDEVSSYTGMRKISLDKDTAGITRICLNNEPLFLQGPLDQGWWPDGLYTAPTDEALKYDIEVTKQLGLNMARKHVKVEPERWYYWCDKLGLLVWQDMPSGDHYLSPADPDFVRNPESAQQFELELGRMLEIFGNHPGIIIWVAFNEGWGQYDTPRIVDLIKTKDPGRLVIGASGWVDRGVGDIHDIHAYPGPAMPEPEENRAIVLGEFGGLGLPLKGHTWQEQGSWGYREFQSTEELTSAYEHLIFQLQNLKARGLSAAVYTQTTDVEVEVNGLMTYDRAVIKMDPNTVARINNGYLPPVIQSQNDIFLESANIEIMNVTQPGAIRYTLNGSEPGQTSFLYEKPITITATTTVKARNFWQDGTTSKVTEHLFEKVSLTESVLISNLKPGVKFAYFENNQERWSKLSDFATITPKATGVTRIFDLGQAQRAEDFGFVFDGYLEVARDGIYTFYLNSDDGSQLFVGSKLLVDNDLIHGMTEQKGEIALKAGLHPLKVTFFQGRGGQGLEVRYEGPAIKKNVIPRQVLFHSEE